jgi:hypothetical protein
VLAALSMPVMSYGMLYGRDSGQNYVVAVIGAVMLFASLYAWGLEPSAEPEEPEPPAPEDAEAPALVGAPPAAALDAGAEPPPPGTDGEGG